MMPGFTAPKLLWVKHHEADNFARIDKVLLPKDYLRWLLTGDFAGDMSDAAGTLWLNTQKREWDTNLLEAWALT
jgi:xylulokinase